MASNTNEELILKPRFDRDGNLLHFFNHKCVKKTCAVEKNQTMPDYRQILLPSALYKYFQFPKWCSTKKAFAFCVTHFRKELRDKIANGEVKNVTVHMFNNGEPSGKIATRKEVCSSEVQERLLEALTPPQVLNDEFGIIYNEALLLGQPGSNDSMQEPSTSQQTISENRRICTVEKVLFEPLNDTQPSTINQNAFDAIMSSMPAQPPTVNTFDVDALDRESQPQPQSNANKEFGKKNLRAVFIHILKY